MWLQREDLKLQYEELRQTREELRLTRLEAARTASAQESSQESRSAQQFLKCLNRFTRQRLNSVDASRERRQPGRVVLGFERSILRDPPP